MNIPQSAPFLRSSLTVNQLNLLVLAALVPGALLKVWFAGPGTAINLALATGTTLGLESVCITLRHKSPWPYLRDCSALLTGALVGLSLPALAAWWVPVAGGAFAILLVKQAFGGLGQNLFNPAMGGAAFLMLAFPQQIPGLNGVILGSVPPLPPGDGMTGDGAASLSIAAAYLAGGLFLLLKTSIPWRVPAAILVTVALSTAWLAASQAAPSWQSLATQLLSPALILAAFIVATDPVTSPASPKAQLVYGALIGAAIMLIRQGGTYGDGVAFAILLGNFFTPLLDLALRPRALGHASIGPMEGIHE